MLRNKSKNTIVNYFVGLWYDKYVLINLVRQDLQLRYNRSALGVAWSIITPLGLSVIIGLVYSIIYGTRPVDFIPMLFAGLNPWFFISNSADGGTMAYISSEGYIKQTRVHVQIFPMRVVLMSFVNLLYSMVAFFAFYLLLNPEIFGIRMIAVFLGFGIELIAALGIANITAIITLYIRDFQPFQNLLLQGLFYFTPIIYTPEMLDEKGYSLVYQLNPFYYLIEVVRRPAMANKEFDIQVYGIAFVISLVIFWLSIIITMRHSRTISLKL